MSTTPAYLKAHSVIKKLSGLDLQKATETAKHIVESGADRMTLRPSVCIPNFGFAKLIDHTLLKPEATREEIIQLCLEAKEYHFASVCVNPHYVKLCSTLLRNTEVKVCTVIGFPLGATLSSVKGFETRAVCENGATEVDMVLAIGELKSKNYDLVEADIAAVVEAAKPFGATTKVILETALLTDEEKVVASVLSKNAGADFVKTSTGFSKGGATVEDIRLMRKAVGSDLGVKASGGVRDYDTARKMVEYGATRIGASASIKIVQQAQCSAPSSGSTDGY